MGKYISSTRTTKDKRFTYQTRNIGKKILLQLGNLMHISEFNTMNFLTEIKNIDLHLSCSFKNQAKLLKKQSKKRMSHLKFSVFGHSETCKRLTVQERRFLSFKVSISFAQK